MAAFVTTLKSTTERTRTNFCDSASKSSRCVAVVVLYVVSQKNVHSCEMLVITLYRSVVESFVAFTVRFGAILQRFSFVTVKKITMRF